MQSKKTYPYLPAGREILYVGESDSFMQEAKKTAIELSTDAQHPIGAVIVKGGAIIGRGANQARLHHPKLAQLHRSGLCVRRIMKVKSGQKYWLCPGCSSPSDHAEQEAVRNAVKNGHDTTDADLYLWGHFWCCETCWSKMIGGGIKNVYLLEGGEVFFDKTNPGNVIGKTPIRALEK